MKTYYVTMQDGVCEETRTLKAECLQEVVNQVQGEADDWCSAGEWGDHGASIPIHWTLYDERKYEVGSGSIEVNIEPNHEALIAAAGGDADCEHDWTSENEGGCDENPGVWSTGGTSMVFVEHCRKCNLRRIKNITGSQRNPGEHDTVKYDQDSYQHSDTFSDR